MRAVKEQICGAACVVNIIFPLLLREELFVILSAPPRRSARFHFWGTGKMASTSRHRLLSDALVLSSNEQFCQNVIYHRRNCLYCQRCQNCQACSLQAGLSRRNFAWGLRARLKTQRVVAACSTTTGHLTPTWDPTEYPLLSHCALSAVREDGDRNLFL